MKHVFNYIFSFQKLVPRSKYFLYGVCLMLLKYAGELVLFYLFQNRVLGILEFLNPLMSFRFAAKPTDGSSVPNAFNSYLIICMILWSLPFVWAGFSLSARRSLDAGLKSSLAFLFFVPFVNYVLILFLCIRPSSEKVEKNLEKMQVSKLLFKEALAVGSFSAVCCVGVIAIFVYFFESYSGALFVGVPFVHGFVVTGTLNRKSHRRFKDTLKVIFVSLLLSGGLLLLLAMEGAICILMAAPIFMLLSLMGALAANSMYARSFKKRESSFQLFSFFLIPLLIEPISVYNRYFDVPTELSYEVLTSIEIDAPPSAVWSKVVAFPDLDPPEELIFRLGVAYPIRATIEGEGVGAVRYCQFSTGNFVEPITEWNEPAQLSFDVQYQPHPLKELSPYREIHAPHLDNFIQSKRGQFRLISLAGNRTRLEGRTWYEMKIMPVIYWRLFSDEFIHRIHQRVLEHIKREVEEEFLAKK